MTSMHGIKHFIFLPVYLTGGSSRITLLIFLILLHPLLYQLDYVENIVSSLLHHEKIYQLNLLTLLRPYLFIQLMVFRLLSSYFILSFFVVDYIKAILL